MKSVRLTSLLTALSLLIGLAPVPLAAQDTFFAEFQHTYSTGYIATGRQPANGCEKAKQGATTKAKNAGYPQHVAWLPQGGLLSTCKVMSSRPQLLLPGRSFTFTARGVFRQEAVVEPKPRCHPNYKNNEGVCVPNVEWPRYDVNCRGSGVPAPYYTDKKKRFKYSPGPDIFNLDKDKDKWACEMPSPTIADFH